MGVEEYDRLLGPHGQPMDEATSPDSDPSNREGVRVYRPGKLTVTPEGTFQYLPLVDFAERALATAQEVHRKAAGEGADLSGVIFPLTVVERNGTAETRR